MVSVDGVEDDSSDREEARPAAADGPPRPAWSAASLAEDRAVELAGTRVMWIGTPAPLNALGVHPGYEVTAEELHATLPDEVRLHPRLWFPGLILASTRWAESAERRAAIEDAIMESARAAVDHVQRTTPLVQRRLPDSDTALEHAEGVAAAAILHRDVGPATAQDQELHFHAHALIVSAECSDGTLVAPDQDALTDTERRGAAEVFRSELATKLSELGYSARRGSQLGEPLEISAEPPQELNQPQPSAGMERSGGGAVPPDAQALAADEMASPGGGFRRELAAELDRRGYSIDAEPSVGSPPGTAQEQPGDASATDVQGPGRWAPDPLEPYRELLGNRDEIGRLTGSRALEREGTHINDDVWRFPRSDLPEPPLRQGAVVAELRARRIQLAREALWREQEDALMLEGRAREGDPPPELDSNLAASWERVARLADELSALEAEASGQIEERQHLGRPRAEPLRDDAAMDRGGSDIRESPSEVVQTSDGEVAVPDALDQLDVIGEERKRLLAERKARLEEWLAVEPRADIDIWIEARRAELGSPEQYVDRGAARRTRSVEARREAIEQQLEEARQSGTQFDIDGLQKQHDAVRGEEQELRDDNAHLDQRMDPDRLARSIAYQNAYEARRAREIAQQVERSVVEPPDQGVEQAREHLQRLIDELTPAPEQSTAERAEWDALHRETEAWSGRETNAETSLDQGGNAPHPEHGREPRAHEQQPTVANEGPELEAF